MTEVLSAEVLKNYPARDERLVDNMLRAELGKLKRKIIVLDDDPTGVQTVHGVFVYTDWSASTLLEGMREDDGMFFILTNSRGFTAEKTVEEHRVIVQNILAASKETKKDFLIVSRSDSTLRGHYPAETEAIRDTLEAAGGLKTHGEVIMPFFREGGRFTIDGVHYVQEGTELYPAAMTEFARDKSFPYNSSHLGLWCEEKTAGRYRAGDMIYITIDSLRRMDFDGVERQLRGAEGFNKIIVDAVDYFDVKVFCVALARAIGNGKQFLLRSAAAGAKILGQVPDKPLLSRSELISDANENGGVIIIGSHVNKTTQQLLALQSSGLPVEFLEFDQHLVVEPGRLMDEADRVTRLTEELVRKGRTVVVYTRRDRFDLPTQDPQRQLVVSAEISGALTGVIGKLEVQPSFIIAKGGITSNDVGTKALRVRRATVMGQIKPGIPVWMTGPESKFPNMPYIIFPGNVGAPDSLRDITGELLGIDTGQTE